MNLQPLQMPSSQLSVVNPPTPSSTYYDRNMSKHAQRLVMRFRCQARVAGGELRFP